MKFKLILIVSLILAILSIGAVSASDTLYEDSVLDADNCTLEIGEKNIYSTDDVGSFTDLMNDIRNSGDVFDVERDYIFNDETDEENSVVISKNNFIINGNGYTIDGNYQSGIFTISGNNVTINDLTFINANSTVGSALNIMDDCEVTTNNVTFENNTANYGIVFSMGDYFSNDDKFLDSTTTDIGVISLQNSNAIITNALMMSSKELSWGFIYDYQNSSICVFNSTFANTTSKYSTAIYSGKTARIENSKFINLHAVFSAGAIAVKKADECIIDNCTFINVTSEKNGGVILADINDQSYVKRVLINNSKFVDSYSEFGGAIMQYGSNLIVENCNFTNNSALFDGGAIYSSYVVLRLINSVFDENWVQYNGTDRDTYGGTIFCDMGGFNFIDSTLTNSYAKTGGAIYLYDSNYYVVNSTFNNNFNSNESYDDIFSVFDMGYAYLEDNTYSGIGSVSLNNTKYETIINATGMKLDLINNTIDVTTLPSKFDLRDWGWVTPVRDQGNMGACWAFGTAGAIESAVLRYLGLEIDVSENNMQDVSLQYYMYGTKGAVEGASTLLGSAYALSWFGVFSSDYDNYDQLGKTSPIIAVEDSIHFQDVVLIPYRQNVTDNNHLKEALLKYGALAVTYYACQEAPYFNEETSAQYCNQSMHLNHAVTLVGWDDFYSAENFLITPPGDGAWIFKNSWGESSGDEGYFYISYYDQSFLTELPAIGFILENTVEYNKNYQYDIGGSLTFKNSSNEYANIFVAVEDDFIAGVGTYFADPDVNYTVEVYVNDDLKLNQSGVSPFFGFNTIQLDSYIPIEEGDVFAVKIKSNMLPIIEGSRQHYIEGSSQYVVDGKWVNASDNNEVCPIKVYTVDEAPEKLDTYLIAAYYNANCMLVATLTDEEGDVIANEDVVFNVGDESFTAETNFAGQAKVSTRDWAPGNYTVTASFEGNYNYGASEASVDFTVKANTNISAVYNDSDLIATLINDVTGQPIKGANLRFTVNGQKYTVKTNANGQAKVSISNLAPGTYNAIVAYNGNGKYNPYAISVDIVVNKISTCICAFYDNATNELVANLINAETGDAIISANVVINLNGVKTVLKTDKQGKVKLSLNDTDSKTFTASFSYGGNSKYLKSTAKVNAVENKIATCLSTVYEKQTGELMSTLINAQTGNAIKGANVAFNLNGEKTVVKTNKEGKAIISIADLDPDEYSIGSSYFGNSKYSGSSVSINIIKD